MFPSLQLSNLLKQSVFLRPWVAIALVSNSAIQQWCKQSNLLKPVLSLSRWLGQSTLGIPWLKQSAHLLLTLGVTVLLFVLTVADTQMIGLGVLLLFALSALLWLFFRPKILSRITVIDILVGTFFLSACFSAAFSSFWVTSIVGLAKMFTFFVAYIVFRAVAERGVSTIVLLVTALTLIGLGEALVGFYQFVNHVQPLATWSDPTINSELKMSRIFGTLLPLNPNLLAGFLTPCAAAALGMFAISLSWRRRVISLGLLAVTLGIVFAIILTGSRGGFLSIAAMVLCSFAYGGHLIWHSPQLTSVKWLKKAWLLTLISTLVITFLGITSSQKIQSRMLSMFAMRNDSSISYRLNVYHSAFEMLSDNPVFGIGPGNDTFKQVYGLYMTPGYNALGSYSVPLEIAVEQGFIGLFIFCSLLFVVLLRIIFALDVAETLTLPHQYLMGALLTAVAGSVGYGIFDTIWYRPAVNLVFWLIIASLAKLTEVHHQSIKE